MSGAATGHRHPPSQLNPKPHSKDTCHETGYRHHRASSGFGALTARALAQAGHIVYASMRETAGRNASQVADVARYATEHGVDLRTVELDVASDESAKAGIAKVIADNGR